MFPTAGRVRNEQQLHSPGFFRPPSALALIAASARGDDIAPAVRAALHAWNHVVAAQLPGGKLSAAVGAGVVIAPEQQGVGQWQLVTLPVPWQATIQRNDRMQLDGRALAFAIPAAVKNEAFLAPLPGNAIAGGRRDGFFGAQPLRRITGKIQSQYLYLVSPVYFHFQLSLCRIERILPCFRLAT